VCNYDGLSRLTVGQHAKIPEDVQKTGVRDVLDKMGRIPEVFTEEMVASGKEFLDSIGSHVLDAKKFTAGSFWNSLPAWKELLKESKRQSSKKMLKWIKEGV
jgi:hypothetical protein